MLNNYADSGGGFNSNHGQTARPTETQKQQNLGASWSYNSQLEGIYYGSEHQPMYMSPYDGGTKHASYPQYPSGTLHQPVPTPVVQCHETCCQHIENRYPINPAPLRYQPSGQLQPRYSDIPNGDSRQYFPDRRPVQVNLPRKKVYPTENGYAGIPDRHYSQYMGRGQALPIDSRQQMQVMRPQYPVYPHYWGGSRGWTGGRMNCPPPSYHQSVNQSAQLQPGTKVSDGPQYMDPSLQKTLGAQQQRGVSSSSGKLDIIRPLPESKRPTLDSSLQSCYDYGYQTGFLPFSEVNKLQGKSVNSQSMNVPCKMPTEKQYHSQQMQYSYQNNERNLISYANPSNDPSYTMNFPLSSNDLHTRPDLEEGQQSSGARKLSMHYDSSGKKRQDLDLRQYLATWEDDEDESARLSEPPLSVGSTATPYIVVECSTLENATAAKLQERFKPLASSQDCSTKPRGSSPNSEHKRSNEQARQEERTERIITHSDLLSQTTYAPSMPTLLSDSDKNQNFWNGMNKECDTVIGKGGAFQPLDCSKRDGNINPKVVSQRESLPPRDVPAHKVLCSSDPNSSLDALVSFYGDNRRVSGGYDLVEMSERLINSSEKARIDHQPSAEQARPCDPRLQQPQHSNNPSMYDKLSSRFSTNNYQHFKGVPTDPYYNYKHPMHSSDKYYGYENSPIINSNYDYNKFVSEFDNTRLYENKGALKDPNRVLYPDDQKNPQISLIEPLPKSSMPNCFQDKPSLEYTSLEPDHFMSPTIEKSTDNRSKSCSQKSNSVEDGLNQQKTNFSNVLSTGIESQVKSEKTVLVTSQNVPLEVLKMSSSPIKEADHKDNVVTLHAGDQSKNTITVEVPYVQQYSTLVKLSEEISGTVIDDENESLGLTNEDKTPTEEIKKPTCFKLKRLPNSKEWTVEGNKNPESGGKEDLCSPKSSEAIEDSDILKTSVSVSNLNMPSLDDIRDGEETCEVLENHSKTKASEEVLCPNKASGQPPQLAIVQPMKLVPCENESPAPTLLQNELNNEDGKMKQSLKAFRSFHNHNINVGSFSNDKPISDCDSQIEGTQSDISKHENFRSHKKIQGNFSNTFPNCLSSPNEEFSHSQEVHSETTKQQYSPFHMYTDCEVNSQIPDFFKMDQRSSSNEKVLDKQMPTSPGVEGMFEDINHSTNNHLCHNQIYQSKSCNFQDLSGTSMSSFDNHNSHFQSFSSIFADDSNNKERCDGSVLQMGDKKYLKHLLDDIERQQVSNTLEERVSKLKSNFMNGTSNHKACQAKKSPPIPPINLKLSESKKIWCITNKDQHLNLSDFSENGSLSLASKSPHTEQATSLMEDKNEKEKYLMEIDPEEANQECHKNESTLLPSGENFNDVDNSDKAEKEPFLNQLSSETIIDKEYSLSEHTSILKDIDTTSAQIPFISGIDSANKRFSESTSQPLTDINDETTICSLSLQSEKENRCLAIVKYCPRYGVLKGNFLYNIDRNISENVLVFDEKGKHFPQESKGEVSHDLESKSIAKSIVELLIQNVIFSRDMVDSLGDEPVNVSQGKITQPVQVNSSSREENIETVIKFDKSSSSSKYFNEQKHISKTTEIFIKREKEHNQHSSVIKATQPEKYFCRLDERKIWSQSIFSPLPEDGKDNNAVSSYNRTPVENKLTEEKLTLDSGFIETKDNNDSMDVDVIKNNDENQPLDYSLGDLTTNKDNSSLNGPTSGNIISADSSEDHCSFGGNVGFNISSNTDFTIECNNSDSFSIEKVNKSCSKNQPLEVDCVLVCENDEFKNNYHSTSLSDENSTVEDSCSSDKSYFDSDYDISDSEPPTEKETSAKKLGEVSNVKDVDFSNEEEMDSNVILSNERLLTACSEKEITKITVKNTNEFKGHILKCEQLSPKGISLPPTVTKENLASEPVELNRNSTGLEEYLTTKENPSLNGSLKSLNTLKSNESNCSLSMEESQAINSTNPRDGCPLQPSEDKTKELLTVTRPYNYCINEESVPKFYTEERSETSVIVRNNTFTTMNNHFTESSSKNIDQIRSKANNECDFPTSKSNTLNEEIADISKSDSEKCLMSDLKEKSFKEAIVNDGYSNFSEIFKQIPKDSIVECNISEKPNEHMEVESTSVSQTLVTPTTDLNASVATKSFDEKSDDLKVSYCVSESVFLNIIDEDSVLCMEISNSSYIFDFKKRKLLKFCKSVSEPKITFNKNSKNYNRDFSIINFGMNAGLQVCSTNAVISDTAYPKPESSHFNKTQTETNHEIQESAGEENSASLSEYKENTTDPFEQNFDTLESVDPLYTDDKNENHIASESKGDHYDGEGCTVLKPNKNIVVLKSKLCLSQERKSFCIRRDSLKILEPEAVLKEIFSPDPDIEDSESKENYFSADHTKDKRNSSNNSEKFSLAPSSLGSICSDSPIEHKWNSINSSSQNFADVNCNLLSSEKNEPIVSTTLEVCISDVTSETDYEATSDPADEADSTRSLSNSLQTRDHFKHTIVNEQFPFIGAHLLEEKGLIEGQQDSKTSSLEDCSSKNGSDSHGYFTDSLTHSSQTLLLHPSKSIECSNQTSVVSTLHSKGSYEEECSEYKVKNSDTNFSHEDQRSTESLSGIAAQGTPTLSCQASNLDNHVSHIEKSVSTMAIVTGRDVLFSSRFLEDEEDKELNSELETENSSRKSSLAEESILDCQNMKMNSQDSLRSSETFPLQCLVDAALALENTDSKQMLLNSSSFSGIYSQSSQSLIKSTIGDVHPNDIEDVPEKNFPSSSSDSSACKGDALSAADQEIFSKFEENNYNLRASTRIVTSSSSNIIPYSKRYYRLKSQKLPKSPLEKFKKSETLVKKIQTKKRKDVFTYPRTKRRKKGLKEKPKYQQKNQQDFKEPSGNNSIQDRSKDVSIKNCEDDQENCFDEQPGSNHYEREVKKGFESHNTKQSAESYDLSSSGKSNFGGPLIIANENSSAENNIFCVHVNSDKMDEYVNDLNVGGLELLSDHNQSVFKDNSMEEQCETPDVTLENGTSLVIIIEDLGENGGKNNYYNTCNSDSDVVLGSIEERSPLPQPTSILDYSSENLTSEVSLNESCICPSEFDNERNCDHSLFNDSKSLQSNRSISTKSFEINSGNLESYEKYSAECNELLSTNCYEEINETLENDIGNWPFVEEEVAEFSTKSVSPNRIPEEGRKIELKCSLPWNKIFNMTKSKKKKNKTSHKVAGLELGPAKVEVRLRAPSTEWKVISDYAENSSPVVKVGRLILQRESETSSYSEKDSEEENESRRLLSPSSVTSEFIDNSDSNDISKNLIEDETWQPVVLLTRDKELDELTRSRARYKELEMVTRSNTGDQELVDFALTLESQLLPEQSNFTGVSSQNNEDVNKTDSESVSSEIASDESRVDCNSSEHSKSSGSLQTYFKSIETVLSDHFSGKRNARYQSKRTEKGCTYETYSPSRHDGSQADEPIYSPSDPHYSPEPGYPFSDSSSFGDKKKSDRASESDISHIDNDYNSLHQANFESFNTFDKVTKNEESDLHRTACYRSKSSLFSFTPENTNSQDSETSDTNYSSETHISSLFDVGKNHLAETNSSSHEEVLQVNNQYVRPDLLNTPNIISNESRKSDRRQSVAEENLRKFKRKMPKNFFVRRKSRKNTDHQNEAIKKILLEEKQVEGDSGGSSFLVDKSPNSTGFALRERMSSNNSLPESIPNEWQVGQSSPFTQDHMKNITSDFSFENANSRLPRIDNLKDPYNTKLNDAPMVERFEEKLRLRDGGRGLKRPCEGHSKEDTKRRRKNLRNHSNKCQDSQFEAKEELSRHRAENHAGTRELHHCLLCQRSFSSGARHRLHMQGRSHRHIELTQRHTIHAVHRLLVGEDCPRIPSLNRTELQTLQWRPTQPGYSHFYYQLTPLQTVLQEHNSEGSVEMVAEETRVPND